MENIPPSSARQSAQALEEGDERLEQEERPLTDEEIAWKLMQEEEDEFQKRMLAMAGVGTIWIMDGKAVSILVQVSTLPLF